MNPLVQLQQHIEKAGLWESELTLNRQEYLAVKGSTDSSLYFVVEGSLRIFILDAHEEHSIRFAYKNSFFSALDTYITGKPTAFYIQALKKTMLKKISKTSFIRFIETDPGHSLIWQQLLMELVAQQLEREVDILTSSPLERYQRVLKRSPQLFQEVPHKYIASYLRMSPETLSRLKKS